MTGTGRVLSGVLGAGLFTYVFLALAGRVLGPEGFAPVSTLWALVFILGPGLFLPVQQELGRLLAHQRGTRGGRAALVRVGCLAVGLVVVAVGTCFGARSWLTRELFDGDPVLFGCLVVSVAAYALTYVARGVLTGVGDYDVLGRLIAVESLARLVVASGLVVVGAGSPGAFGVAIAAAPLLSTGVVTRFGSRLRVGMGAPVRWREATRSLGWLVTAALASQVLANAGPLAVQSLAGPSEGNQAGRFLSALVVSRLGLFLFQAAQATMLPNLAVVVAAGRNEEVLRALRRITVACAALVALTTGAALALGPTAVTLLFGEGFAVSGRTMATLTGASGCLVLALALSSAAVAAGAHRFNASAWWSGCAAFAAAATVPDDLFLRVEVGYLVGSAGAALIFVVGLPSLLRRRPVVAVPPSPSRP